MFLKQPKPGLRHLLLIAVILMIGCKKAGDTNEGELKPEVAEAKLWYDKAYTALKPAKHNATVTANKTFDFSVLINPDWQNALTYQRHGDEVIEIPVEQPGKFGVGLIGKGDAAVEYKPENSKTIFVLLKNAGGYRAFIMTLIADADYLKGDYTKLQNNHYNKRDPKFSGVLVYYTPEGKYSNNWTYKDGNCLVNNSL
ncbi:hypothetical protein [Mucilaginibacter terrae]|nr:hypothetical protein [Mucilaginibacter terrae]